jgi:large exoprotein involved in heme utilization and adhesion
MWHDFTRISAQRHIGANSGLFARSDSTGAAGSVTINTLQLRVQEGAEVTVSSLQGQTGNLRIAADSLFLDRGSITAETGKSGAEGKANITLQISDLLTLRNESKISAEAFEIANGGNIGIDTKFMIAFPPEGSEGSDIIANADRGEGGNINIKTQGIFGIEEQRAIPGNQTNDIDASSEFGLEGEVTIAQPDVEPSRGLIELPETVVDPNALVAQNPCKQGSESEFVITGRGGLPPSLNEDSNSKATQVGLVEPAPMEAGELGEQGSREAEDKTSSTPSVPTPIIPAQGWVFNEKGEVVLVAYDPTVTGPQRLRENGKGCTIP